MKDIILLTGDSFRKQIGKYTTKHKIIYLNIFYRNMLMDH